MHTLTACAHRQLVCDMGEKEVAHRLDTGQTYLCGCLLSVSISYPENRVLGAIHKLRHPCWGEGGIPKKMTFYDTGGGGE